MVSRRTTLRDIAKVCGCSAMTVSLALRNHASVSKKRRAEIRAVAKKLDYSPDPTLSALAAYRRAYDPDARLVRRALLQPDLRAPGAQPDDVLEDLDLPTEWRLGHI